MNTFRERSVTDQLRIIKATGRALSTLQEWNCHNDDPDSAAHARTAAALLIQQVSALSAIAPDREEPRYFRQFRETYLREATFTKEQLDANKVAARDYYEQHRQQLHREFNAKPAAIDDLQQELLIRERDEARTMLRSLTDACLKVIKADHAIWATEYREAREIVEQANEFLLPF